MKNLVLPQSISIQLVDPSKSPVLSENILLYLKTTARTKADYHLGPFTSDEKGTIYITRADLEREVDVELDTGFLDYSDIESCYPEVEIRIYTQNDIEVFIESRSTTWNKLLYRENERWDTMEVLIDFLKNSNNKHFNIQTDNRSLSVVLDGSKASYEFEMTLYNKIIP